MLLAASGVLVPAAVAPALAQSTEPAAAPAPASVAASKLPFATPLKWSASDVLIKPVSDAAHQIMSVKDPTIVRFDNKWHRTASTGNGRPFQRPPRFKGRLQASTMSHLKMA
jgi:hypothetical protein